MFGALCPLYLNGLAIALQYFSSVAYGTVPSTHDIYASSAMTAQLGWLTAVREEVDLHVGLNLMEDIGTFSL